jgi:bifunctional non-homologous end joining protein LigD
MKDEKEILIIEGHRVEVSHPDKLFWPTEKISKKMLIDYYQSISAWLLPFLKGRPLSLLRHPQGIEADSFYHKDAGEHVPGWVKTFSVPSASSNKVIDYIVCNNAATLAFLNNLGCIEFNPWHSVTRKPDNPDYLVIDLDPSNENSFDQVMEVALVFYDIMRANGVSAYCKTSGASGMHLFIPLGRKLRYETVRDLAHKICLMIKNRIPFITTLERVLSKRKGRIYLDYLQNSKGQTIASVFSVRPRASATISMPLDWTELKPGFLPTKFNIFNSASEARLRVELFSKVLDKAADLRQFKKTLDQNITTSK